MHVSAWPGVRVDTWIESGTEVTPFYDSLLGKLMVHGSSRADAVKRMVAALQGTVLGGIPSNLEYLGAIVASQGFRAGVTTLARTPPRLQAVPACVRRQPPLRCGHAKHIAKQLGTPPAAC